MTLEDNFYSSLLAWDWIKLVYVITHIVITLMSPGLFVFIIGYEKTSHDLIYRTLINQLLSHLCGILIVGCLVVRLPSIYFLTFGSLPSGGCYVSSFLGYAIYLSMVSEVFLRQMIKYLYIFKFKHIVGLNDDIFAVFLTSFNVMISSLLAFSESFKGHLIRRDLDFHICTGKPPSDNLLELARESQGSKNVTFQPVLLQSNLYGSHSSASPVDSLMIDGQAIYLRFVVITTVLMSIQIWFYGRKRTFRKFFNIAKNRICRVSPEPLPIATSDANNDVIIPANDITATAAAGACTNHKFHDGGNFIIGNGHILVIIALGAVSMMPTRRVREMAGSDISSLLTFEGKLWFHVAKISGLVFHYIVLPVLIIAFNPEMRKSLSRQLIQGFKIVFQRKLCLAETN